jgi:fibronectin type III domain protein
MTQPATLDLPGVGKVDRRWLWAGGAAVVGILAYAYWRNARIDDGGGELVIDPSTGATDPSGAAPGPNAGGDVDASPEGDKTPDTNAEWTQLAIEALQAVGYEPGHVASVLGKYLGRRPLTADEQDLVRTVWAMIGQPPEGSYPLSPTPEPDPEPSKVLPGPVLGLRVLSTTRSSFRIDWSPPAANSGGMVIRYNIRRSKPTVGSIVPTLNTSYTTQSPLKSNSTYSFQVRAVNVHGAGPWSETTAKTKK